MSSAFFRRPTDDSSDSDSIESEDVDTSPQRLPDSRDQEVEAATTESLSSHGSISVGEGQEVPFTDLHNIEQHRSILLSALLEDFVKNRACEEMNKAHPGRNFDRNSPEIQPLARRLFQQASQPLALNGWIAPMAANDNAGSRQTRATYLAGVESLARGRLPGSGLLSAGGPAQLSLDNQSRSLMRVDNLTQVLAQPNVASMANLSFYPQPSSPYSDLRLTTPTIRRSHYESSFQQLKFLGRGGFGSVYHTFNVFDKKEYAVKKIPLSPRLSQRYKESGHQELESVLREVQALAQLEHNNIVRYHATWIEEPKESPAVAHPPRKPSLTVQGRKLIEAGPDARHNRHERDRFRLRVTEESDGIVFGSDSVAKEGAEDPDLDSRASMPIHATETESVAGRTSEMFTDGDARPSVQRDSILDGSVYVLHVQMSVYPMTLAQYLAPGGKSMKNSPDGLSRRHCFHLVPALRILLGILCGLQYIHAKGMIHRDVKPSNIFISSMSLNTGSLIAEGYHNVGSCVGCNDPMPHYINPRIGDFGLVADASAQGVFAARGGRPVGTQYYRPPSYRDQQDKWNSNTVDEKLDVFALGVILVEMLWSCTTSTERVHVLQGLQRGKIPAGLSKKIEQEGQQSQTADLVIQGISGMIERNPRERWGCASVTAWIRTILDRCTTFRELEPAHDQFVGEELGTVRSLDEVEGEIERNSHS